MKYGVGTFSKRYKFHPCDFVQARGWKLTQTMQMGHPRKYCTSDSFHPEFSAVRSIDFLLYWQKANVVSLMIFYIIVIECSIFKKQNW